MEDEGEPSEYCPALYDEQLVAYALLRSETDAKQTIELHTTSSSRSRLPCKLAV